MLKVWKVHATFWMYGTYNIEGVKRNIQTNIWLHLRHLFVMLKVSKALYTYIFME